MASHIRLVKQPVPLPAIEHTVYEDKGFQPSDFIEDMPIADEREWFEIKSTLAHSPLIYYPPFLRHNEIRRHRFAEMKYRGQRIRTEDDMNDRWWEWEEELGLPQKELCIMGLTPGWKEHSGPLPRLTRAHKVVVRGGKKRTAPVVRIPVLCSQCGHLFQPRDDGEPYKHSNCKTQL